MPPALCYEFLAEINVVGVVRIPSFNVQVDALEPDWKTVGVLDDQEDGERLSGFQTPGSVADHFRLAAVVETEGEGLEAVVDFRIESDQGDEVWGQFAEHHAADFAGGVFLLR